MALAYAADSPLSDALANDSLVFADKWWTAPEVGEPIEFGADVPAEPPSRPDQQLDDLLPTGLPSAAASSDAVLAGWQQDDLRFH